MQVTKLPPSPGHMCHHSFRMPMSQFASAVPSTVCHSLPPHSFTHCNSYPEAKKRGPKPGQLLRVKEEAKVLAVLALSAAALPRWRSLP